VIYRAASACFPGSSQTARRAAGIFDLLGAHVEPLDEERIHQSAVGTRAAGIRAIAVMFLHSHASAADEQRPAEILRQVYSAAAISLSGDVLPGV
jgi:N-methylhydantoinase A/oxoprolinase/acetone carboxylase beta subunit